MVLTITVVGNGQGNNNGNHAVLSPNELAQFMSGQTVTGLLNPDGSITLNSNVMPAQQLTSMPPSLPNGTSTQITNTPGPQYSSRLPVETIPVSSTNSISNIQAISGDSSISNNHSPNTTTTQKKTGQKRLTAKQKLAQQQQQQHQQQQQQSQNQQMQSPDSRQAMNSQSDQPMNQQPHVVATVQLPNGQIGQLIAPSGGQFWSPNAINLQQLSMAVAAATNTMPQPMSLPANSSTPSGHQHQNTNPNVQQQATQQSSIQQSSSQQQATSQQSLNGNTNQQQVITTMQLPNNQIGQVVGRPCQNQLWSGAPISLSQLSALAQQGVVQLSPVQGVPTNGPNGQRVIEMIPQAAIQGLLGQNGQPVQTMPLSGGGQMITQDPNDPGKWQLVPPDHPIDQQQSSNLQQSSSGNSAISNPEPTTLTRNDGPGGHFSNSTSQNNTVLNNNAQSVQPQRKLKRLACTCPNCRDGDNNRSNGDKKKQHICHFPDCNKVYGKTSHLRAHLRWHSGERPYVCNWSFCGKKFTRSDELQRHRRTHTGEKRFQCPECLKRFMRSDHLSKHLKTHLSSKKCSSTQQPNGIPTIVTMPQNSVSIKLEDDMIDEVALEGLEESDKQQPGCHGTIKTECQ